MFYSVLKSKGSTITFQMAATQQTVDTVLEEISLVQKFIISKYHSDLKFNINIDNCLRHAGLYIRYCRYDKCVPNRLRFELKNIILNFPGQHKKLNSDSNHYQSLYSRSISLDPSKTLKGNNVKSFNKLNNTTTSWSQNLFLRRISKRASRR